MFLCILLHVHIILIKIQLVNERLLICESSLALPIRICFKIKSPQGAFHEN